MMVLMFYVCVFLGIESFLMYSVHEGIRGVPLDPNDKTDALMPISGTSFAVGIDFHAGESLFDKHALLIIKDCHIFESLNMKLVHSSQFAPSFIQNQQFNHYLILV